ncbi:hypothetical protein GGF46_001528 [Coemansia sp. RSA 552]|nr:hypothetical protein GGF46_001528 [Coemansia sp. RSA 552]
MPEVLVFDADAGSRSTLAVDLHSVHTNTSAAGHQHPWHELLDEPKQLQPPGEGPCTASGTEDITTQGLLEGLEDLYDEECEGSVSATVSLAKDDAELDELDNMDPDEADAIMRGLDDFEPVKSPAKEHGDSQHDTGADTAAKQTVVQSSQLLGEQELGEMGDAEAGRIIGSFGGFSTAFSARKTASSDQAPGNTNSQRVKTESLQGATAASSPGMGPGADELSDMNDAEAQSIITSLGGFARPRARAKQAPAVAASTPTPQTRQEDQRHSPIRRQPEPAPKAASPFPSKNDVLSARRALKLEGGKPQAHGFSSPLRKPVAPPGIRSSPGITPRRAVAVNVPRRQLAFKLPGLKRPPARQQQFNSPTKRLAVDGEPSPCSNGQPTVRRMQFAQRFRSPTKIPGTDRPDDQGASPRPLLRNRPPPMLPPVTSKRPGPSPPEASQQPARVFDLTPPQERCNLKSLAGLVDAGQLQDVPRDALAMTSGLAATYGFPLGAPGMRWGVDEARQALLGRGCVPGVVNPSWVRNHFRWAVWSSACYSRRIPSRWHEFWSIDHVLYRLLYRYEREYVRGERSALKQVLEGDAAPQQLMILCVASIESDHADTTIEVTDGWYSIGASVDQALKQAILNGRLRIGDKIACSGASLHGATEGVDPLSAESQRVTLALGANCVRRARWHARLGFQRNGAMFMSLAAIHRQGGAVGATLDVVVMRRYPTLFMEYLPNGQRVIRSEKEEVRISLASDERRAARMQEIMEQRRAQCDPDALAQMQASELERYTVDKGAEDEAAAMGVVDEELPPRQVQPFFRMRVCDYPAHECKPSGADAAGQALVTVWNSRSIEAGDLAEGSRLQIVGAKVSPRGTRHQTSSQQAGTIVSLNVSTSGGRLKPMPANPQLVAETEYCDRGALHVDELRHVKPNQEVDVTGSVSSHRPGQNSQMSVLRLCSTDDHGAEHIAEIRFPDSVFGAIKPQAGSTVTVHNCWYTQQPGAESRMYQLYADDTAKFAL